MDGATLLKIVGDIQKGIDDRKAMIEEFPAKLKEAVEKNQAEYAMLKERLEVFAPFADKLKPADPPENDKTNTWEEETDDEDGRV